jgi:hypothetical protein
MTPEVGFRASAKRALKEAASSFKPWWLRTLLATVAVHGAVSLYLFVNGPSFWGLVGIPLSVVWGALLGAVIGLLGGGYAVVVRLAGWTALAPLVLMPLGMALAFWLLGDWVDGSWSAVGKLLSDLGDGPGFAGARVGHPIVLIIILPLLLILAIPVALLVAWALLITAAVLALGFTVGLTLSLPPVLAGVAIKSARFVAQVRKEKAASLGAGSGPAPGSST